MKLNSALRSTGRRPLAIDFDLHTDGDLDFKKDLVVLMIENLNELLAVQKKNDRDLFSKVCHKIKATLEIVNDKDLNDVVAKLSDPLLASAVSSDDVLMFNVLCQEIIKSLEKEIA